MTGGCQELTKTTLPAEKAALEQQLATFFTQCSGSNGAAIAKQQLLMLGDDEFPCARRLPREGKLMGIRRLKLLQVALLEQKRAKELHLQKAHEQQRTIRSLLANERLLCRCEFVRARSLSEIAELKHSWRFAPPSHSSVLHGWQETRVVENDTISWSMQKVVKLRRPRVMAQKTWEIFADPERWAKLFSADTEVHCRVVEHVDASNVLMLQHYRDRDRGVERSKQEGWKKTLALVTCATTATGSLLVVVRGLPSDRVFAPTVAESLDDMLSRDGIWTDIFCWCVRFRARGTLHGHR